MTMPVAESHATDTKKYYGKYPAVVKNTNPPQKGDHRGEILVEVHGLLEEDPSDGTGKKQRKIQVLAKPCFPPGFFFLPDPNDHVWVEFAAGEIDEPLWTGVWYPDKAQPKTPDGKSPTKDQRVLRTKFGHLVLLDDTSGKEKVVVQTNKNVITMDSKGTKIEDQNNSNTITMDSNGLVLACGNSRKITVSSSTVKIE